MAFGLAHFSSLEVALALEQMVFDLVVDRLFAIAQVNSRELMGGIDLKHGLKLAFRPEVIPLAVLAESAPEEHLDRSRDFWVLVLGKERRKVAREILGAF